MAVKLNTLDKQYTDLLKTIIEHGVEKADRTGTGTKSIFGYTIRHNMKEGFPMLTTKKLPWKLIVTELMWFLNGYTNIQFLVRNNCHIWDGDCYKNYLNNWNKENPPFGGPYVNNQLTLEKFIQKIKEDDTFARAWGDLGPIYGAQWRSWRVGEGIPTALTDNEGETIYEAASRYIDQFQDAIDLLKNDPDSRRNRVSAWNVGELRNMKLPPCHTDFQLYTRELTLKERVDYGSERGLWELGQTINYMHCDELRIPTRAVSLMWNQRSVDTFLGLPFNIASYGLLLSIIGEIVNMVPDQLIGNLGDTHLYLNHLDQAAEQIGREYTDEELEELYPELKRLRTIKIAEIHKQNYEEAAAARQAEKDLLATIVQNTRTPFPLPKLIMNTEFWNPGTDDGCGMGPGTYTESMNGLIESFEIGDFMLEDYKAHPHIPAPLSN